MRQTAVAFKSKGLTLEGVIAFPQGLTGPFPGAVVCHPHPLFGGNMDNGLVQEVCSALVREGFGTFRFNFRGVGNSEGAFTKGEKEPEDVNAALSLLRIRLRAAFTKGEKEPEDVNAALSLMRNWPDIDKRRFGLVGYSFGASMVLNSISKYKAAKALALISPPLTSLDHPKIESDKRPKLFIVGDRDRLVPHSALKAKVESLPTPVDLSIVPGADHSWRNYEAEAAHLTVRFLVGALRR